MSMSRIASFAFAILITIVAPGLRAGPVTVDGPWFEFSFGASGTFAAGCVSVGCVPSSGGNSVFADDPPWTFTAAGGTTFTITDAFDKGDSFSVFDFGVLVGSTPSVAAGGNCGSDPAVCVLDPTVSHASFGLAGGSHSITIRVDDSPFGGGAAYFRIDTAAVPEPATLVLLGIALAGLGFSRRKHAAN